MKMKKRTMIPLLLAMAALLSVNVTAAEEAPETAAQEVMAEISFPGKVEVEVSSGMSTPSTDISLYFDKLADTGYELKVSEDNKTYTVYTSIGVRNYVDLLAVQMTGAEGTNVEVAVYASNNYADWTQVSVTEPTREDGFFVFDLLGDEEKYVFWKVEFTVLCGEGFTMTEMALFQEDRGEPKYEYLMGDEVKDGELPELVPAEEDVQEEPEENSIEKKLRYGWFGFMAGLGK